ncbi:SipW-dependent-type signal peptide-containing protein [Nesterenkonia haasae]|uniref:SipW-dependent-type signal peptide-containing protein n=1 Tax=Nesterenkonia haasae TaxID=2587813 RepID=UPI0013919612|nr:SipW-dependent-type signal peptide-containing protein [Nesterenkonia haasae]NDK31764.1 hypothetical protein [Nesterenkonia haasae]
MPTISESPEQQTYVPNHKTRARKIRAVMAAGAVLGVGALITLAAWTDNQFAEGLFTTGSYNVISSEDGGTYSDHSSAEDSATLEMQAGNTTPGEQFAAGFWLRTDAATTVDGVITGIDVASSSGNVEEYTYSVVHLSDPEADCTVQSTGAQIASGESLGDINFVEFSDVSLHHGGDDSRGAPVQLCFQVEASEELSQGGSASVVWEVQTESTD